MLASQGTVTIGSAIFSPTSASGCAPAANGVQLCDTLHLQLSPPLRFGTHSLSFTQPAPASACSVPVSGQFDLLPAAEIATIAPPSQCFNSSDSIIFILTASSSNPFLILQGALPTVTGSQWLRARLRSFQRFAQLTRLRCRPLQPWRRAATHSRCQPSNLHKSARVSSFFPLKSAKLLSFAVLTINLDNSSNSLVVGNNNLRVANPGAACGPSTPINFNMVKCACGRFAENALHRFNQGQ